MKKTILLMLLTGTLGFGQNSTGTVNLGTSMTAKIDTNTTEVTLTLTGPSTGWFGIGFGGLFMSTAEDMFIWSSSADRDYTSTGQARPSVDAGGANGQNWIILSDDAPGAVRTIVAKRPLVSSGDYTFLNDNSSIEVVYANGTALNLAYHGSASTGRRGASTLTRTSLSLEDFSLNAASVYPVPSKGSFTVQSKTGINNLEIYTQTGAFVKTVNVSPSSNTEVNVQGLSKGTYLIQLKNDNDKSWKKVIIE
jgi:hypothetical protein